MALFTDKEQENIVNAIAEIERSTSGEIRVAIDKHCTGDVIDKALEYFYKLGMDKTKLKNGVLIYLAHLDRKFAIIGDKGINEVVPVDFWETTKVAVKAHFASGKIADGLIAGIKLTGEKLASYFPFEQDDINELPNDIIYVHALKEQ